MKPVRRKENLNIALHTEMLVIDDLKSGQSFRLEGLERMLWELIDGNHSIEEITDRLSEYSDYPISTEAVWQALDGMADVALLANPVNPPASPSHIPRRKFLKTFSAGIVGSASFSLIGLQASGMAYADSTEQQGKVQAEQQAKQSAEQQSKAAEQAQKNPQAEQDQKNNQAEQDQKNPQAEQDRKTQGEQAQKTQAEQQSKSQAEQQSKSQAEQQAKQSTEQQNKAAEQDQKNPQAEQDRKTQAEQQSKSQNQAEQQSKQYSEQLSKTMQEDTEIHKIPEPAILSLFAVGGAAALVANTMRKNKSAEEESD